MLNFGDGSEKTLKIPPPPKKKKNLMLIAEQMMISDIIFPFLTMF